MIRNKRHFSNDCSTLIVLIYLIIKNDDNEVIFSALFSSVNHNPYTNEMQ